MTHYDPELTMEANAVILMDYFSSKPGTFWQETALVEYLKAAYQDGYDEARARWLGEGYVPEAPDEP